jgi:LacI family transcriptional regulator
MPENDRGKRTMSGRVTTLKELAEKLDISVATASRALAGHSRIAKATRERVAEAAREYGYVPNTAARALVSGRSGFAGLVLPMRGSGLVDPFLGEFLTGLTEGLSTQGTDVFLATVPEGRTELHVIQNLVEARRADGLVLARTTEDDPRIAYLSGRGFPFVSHGRVMATLPFHHWLDTDGAWAFAEAFDLLYGLGHRHFGLVTIAEPMTFRRLREEGLRSAIARRGDPEVTLAVVSAPRFDARAREAAIHGLLTRPDRPTAVLGLFDGLALSVLVEAHHLGLSVPRDLSVIGFDNIGSAEHARPALTTFDAAIHDCAIEIAGMLTRVMTAQPARPITRVVQPKFVPRASHGPVPPAT